MKIIAIANDKGGVSKSTTANNLIHALARKGKRLLAIDMDPQGDLTESLAGNKPPTYLQSKKEYPTTYTLLSERDTPNQVIFKLRNYPNISLVPSNRDLSAINLELTTKAGAQLKLRKILRTIPKDDYDYVIIDTGKGFDLLVMNAYSASHYILIVTRPGKSELRAVERTFDDIEETRMEILDGAKYPQVIGVVLAEANRYRTAQESQEYLKGKYNSKVIGVISKREDVSHAWANSQSILEYNPRSQAALDYEALMKEVLRLTT